MKTVRQNATTFVVLRAAHWRRVVEAARCTDCGAEPGHPCHAGQRDGLDCARCDRITCHVAGRVHAARLHAWRQPAAVLADPK